MLADVANIEAVVDRKAVRQLHQRGRRSRLGGVDRPGDVVDGRGTPRNLVGDRVVHFDRPRIGEPGEVGLVLFELRHERFRRHGDCQHLASFLGRPDRVHLHARRGFVEQPHVLVDLFRVRQLAFRTRDVAQDRGRRRHAFRSGKVVHQRRQEEGLGGVLLDLLRVFLVDRLGGIPPGPCGGKFRLAGGVAGLARLFGHRRDRHQDREQQNQLSPLNTTADGHMARNCKSATSYQLRASSFPLPASGMLVPAPGAELAAGSWKLEAGNCQLATGNWQLSTGSANPGR